MRAVHFQQPGVAEPGAPQPRGGGLGRTPYLPGIEPGRADRRYADQLVEFTAEEGERRRNGGAGRGRAQLNGQIPAFRTAGNSYRATASNCRCPACSPSKHNTHISTFDQRMRALHALTGQELYLGTIAYMHTGSCEFSQPGER